MKQFNISKKRFLHFGMVFLLCLLGSCAKVEENIQLEVIVYDLGKVQLQSHSLISIYATEEDWKNEKNTVVMPQKTDSDGKIIFSGLKTGNYVVDIKKDALNNWEGKKEISLKGNGSFARFTVFFIIENNRSSLISAANGKKWTIKSIALNNINTVIADCEKDDILYMEKGSKKGRLRVDYGSKSCKTNDKGEKIGTWRLNESGNILYLETEDFSETWNITSITENTLTLQQQFPSFTITKVYQVIP